ncbi:O-antigen translocase [Shewanella baltica]|uniref:O-antigen translocase n=1 Tax=Shewanella baltica TaxID=62322 RepID=UPI003D78ECD3
MKRLFKVTALSAILTFLKIAIGFVIAKLVAVYTGPTGLALLGQVQSVVAGFNGIANAPVGNGLIRYTAECKNDSFESTSKWWIACSQWTLLLLCIIIPIGIIFSKQLAIWLFENPNWYWIIIIICFGLPLSAFGTLVNSVNNGLQRYRRLIGLGMISVFTSGLVMMYLIINHDLTGALLAVALQSSLMGIVMLFASFKEPWLKLRYWWGCSGLKEQKAIGGYVLMALTTALTIPISMIVIRNVLVAEVGWELTGHWQAVWKISEVYLGVITIALGTYFLPTLAGIKGTVAIKAEINKITSFILPLVVVIALSIYFFRDFIITVLFTEEFRAARELFAIQLCGDVFKILAYIYGYPMLSRGATKWFVATDIMFSLFFVFLSWYFVSNYGLQGMPIAYCINYLTCFVFVYFGVNHFSK